LSDGLFSTLQLREEFPARGTQGENVRDACSRDADGSGFARSFPGLRGDLNPSGLEPRELLRVPL
jgi:hypothetical protein